MDRVVHTLSQHAFERTITGLMSHKKPRKKAKDSDLASKTRSRERTSLVEVPKWRASATYGEVCIELGLTEPADIARELHKLGIERGLTSQLLHKLPSAKTLSRWRHGETEPDASAIASIRFVLPNVGRIYCLVLWGVLEKWKPYLPPDYDFTFNRMVVLCPAVRRYVLSRDKGRGIYSRPRNYRRSSSEALSQIHSPDALAALLLLVADARTAHSRTGRARWKPAMEDAAAAALRLAQRICAAPPFQVVGLEMLDYMYCDIINPPDPTDYQRRAPLHPSLPTRERALAFQRALRQALDLAHRLTYLDGSQRHYIAFLDFIDHHGLQPVRIALNKQREGLAPSKAPRTPLIRKLLTTIG